MFRPNIRAAGLLAAGLAALAPALAFAQNPSPNPGCRLPTSPSEVAQIINNCTAQINGANLPPSALSEAYTSRGVAYGDSGDMARASSDFSDAVRIDPHNVTALANRGAAYAATGDLGRALTDLNEAVRLSPGNPDAYNTRGLIYAQRGDLPHALTDFEMALRGDPNNPGALANRGNVYAAQGNDTRAI